MLDGERPGDEDDGRVVPLARNGKPRGRGTSKRRSVPEQLSDLERKVEASLGVDERDGKRSESMWLAVDEILERYAELRRWLKWDAVVPDGQPLGALPLLALYHYWWRVEAVGLERIPANGPVLLVANRAGTLLPYDAFMVAVGLALDDPSNRRTRPMVDEWLTDLPLVGSVLERLGAEPATPAKLKKVLARGDVAVVFPEGREAFAKSFDRRYRLARFGRTALLRTAIEQDVPIVPVAVIGSEETHPVLWRSERVGQRFGLPAMPITPTLLPLPTKWTLHVGQPLESAGLAEAAGSTAEAVKAARTQVRERLQGLVTEGLGRRKGIFLAS